MEIFQKFSDAFWSSNFWLPPNTTWADMAPGSRPDVQHADYKDLIWPLPLAAVVILLRLTIERFCLAPIGLALGLKSSKPKKAAIIPELAKAYEQSHRLDRRKLKALTKRLDMTERQIERWWRLRRAQDKPTKLTRFCETAWRCLYYSSSFTLGLLILWEKAWLWDFKSCWYGYPHQSYTSDIWWYYMVSMSYYWSLAVTQFFDVKRKDFWQMFVHHVITLLLMSLSWICNLHRVGSLVLVIHDSADIFLEASKLANYTKYQKTCDSLFGIFTLVWIITRLGFFPRLIYSSSIEYPQLMAIFPAYYIFNGLLILLLLLHIVWTYMIVKVLIDSLQKGWMTGDCRSSSDSEALASSEEQQPLSNGNGVQHDNDVSRKRIKKPIDNE